ncbi:hypothetical protein HT746_01175 [Burkholderia pyrrocinia]|uniref:hypothetical protein n=1 Tax=Burkholderia pyrrocinia TaxID=60550 RepID=UPI0015770D00|nr:hypothetical protein [Burkholderia pyrrocinia]NTX25773.1 hypothetical protein [Burkholderia pyrrocinia]
MLISNDQIAKILSAGGGLRLSANGYSMAQLKAFCTAAAAGGARLVLTDIGAYTANQLIALAELAPTLVLFDLVPVATQTAAGAQR